MRKTSRVGPLFEVPQCRKIVRRCGEKRICKSKCQNTSGPEQFLLFPCPKMAGCCGAKHICKSKCTKHLSATPIFAVPMSKKGTPLICKSKCTKHLRSRATLVLPISENGTPLWREAHLQVKMHKTPHGRATF